MSEFWLETLNFLENKTTEKPVWIHIKLLLRISPWGVELERKMVRGGEIVILYIMPVLLEKCLMQ